MKISKQLKFGLIISIILILSVAIISIISISNLDNKNITGKIIKENSKYETINIGAILPLTGNAAEFGLWMKQGLQLAVENTNDDKINNKKLKFSLKIVKVM